MASHYFDQANYQGATTAIADTCVVINELDLGWDDECQSAAIIDLDTSGS